MNPTQLIVLVAIGLVLAMAAAWGVVLKTGKAGWADVFWSAGIGIGAIVLALVPLGGMPGPSWRSELVAVIAAVWALRLGGYILVRTRSGGDDPRYVQLKSEWGNAYRWKLLGFLEIQAGVGLALALTAMAAARSPGPLGWADALGVLIAVLAIGGEALSDQQLRAFRAAPGNRGKVCDAGLWGLSRHPNYFFEWLGWLAYVPIGWRLADYPWGWATLLGPILMYWLLVRVSGIPPLEAHMLRSRPDAFRAYQARVGAFWPIPRPQGAR